MALAKTAAGARELLIKVGDGGSPETFTHNCTINAARGISLTSQMNEVFVPDCSDPDLISWVQREKTAKSASVNGEGTLNTPDAQFFAEWVFDPDPKNVKVVLDVDAVDGGIIFSFAAHCGQFDMNGDRGDKVKATVALQSDGEVLITANS